MINNFSPPLTTSSRSSVALDATPPLSSGGGAVLVVKQDHTLNGPPSANFNALVNAAVQRPLFPLPNLNFCLLVKRSREPKAEYPEKAKRPRANHRTKSEKALRDLVGPIVSETVSDFHRERVADRTVTTDSRRMVTTNATPSTSHDMPVVSQQPIVTGLLSIQLANLSFSAQPAASTLIGTSPLAAVRPQGNVGPSNSTLPSSMEQLLERQWEQGSQFLISQAQFDVAQLLSCLHQLKSENIRLEEQLVQLNRRREHLIALTSRLSVPLGGHSQQQQQQQQAQVQAQQQQQQQQQQQAQQQQQQQIQQQQLMQQVPSVNHHQQGPVPTSIVSPHHSPIVVASTSVPPAGVEDSLTQLRSLASGTPRPTGRPPSQASTVPSTSSFGTSQHGGAGFIPHVQSR
ncbi:unnamed protein product [Haemonchus placei]|uniref:Uncharacterized protein n=1 Tax=Haemonchus placei TaxID=6290 RepID=A0A3P7TU54_HAEPC|nr:unnamed protein product [Haemonchus placei]